MASAGQKTGTMLHAGDSPSESTQLRRPYCGPYSGVRTSFSGPPGGLRDSMAPPDRPALGRTDRTFLMPPPLLSACGRVTPEGAEGCSVAAPLEPGPSPLVEEAPREHICRAVGLCPHGAPEDRKQGLPGTLLCCSPERAVSPAA